MTRLVITSDTHGDHPETPDGDVLVHCGDWTRWAEHYPAANSLVEWLQEQPQPHKVVIAGNHDRTAALEGPAYMRALLAPVGGTYLQDEGAEVGGLRFYGTPWTPPFGTWWFMTDKEDRERYYGAIPDGLDVLVTHGPPHGNFDITWDNRRVGCPILKRVVQERRPRVHCFGHIHEGHGWGRRGPAGGTLMVNAAKKVYVVDVPETGWALPVVG